MTTEHKHSAILRAIAEGKVIQVQRFGTSVWLEKAHGNVLNLLSLPECNFEFRVKSKTITINGKEFDTFAPKLGETYWTPNFGVASEQLHVNAHCDVCCVGSGFCFETEEICKAFLEVVKPV